MYALRDISAGEELTLAYVSPFGDLSERLVHLWRTWGFVCTCRRCQDQLMKRVMERGTEATAPENAAASSSSSYSPAVAGLSAAGVVAALAVAESRSHENSPVSSPSGARAGATATMNESTSVSSAPLEEKGGEASPRLLSTSTFQPPRRGDVATGAAAEDCEDSDDSADEDEDDNEEGEEEEEEGGTDSSSDDEDGRALAGLHPFVSPLGPRGPPPSVLKLEADLKKLMQVMETDGEE